MIRISNDMIRSQRTPIGVLGLAVGCLLLSGCSTLGLSLYPSNSTLTKDESGHELAERLERSGVPLYEVAESVMHSLQDARQPQSVLVLVQHEPLAELPTWGATALVAVAHGVQDPGNLGSLMRTAEAAGAAAFVCSGHGADIHHPRTLRATAGSVFRIPTITLRSTELCSALRLRGLRLVGATPRDGERYDRTDFTCPTAILFGGEGAGLPDSILEGLDSGGADAAVASANATLWPRAQRTVWELYGFGLEALVDMNATAISRFFDSFFQLPLEAWSGFLAGTLAPSELGVVMTRLFRSLPASVRWHLVRRGLSGGAAPLARSVLQSGLT